MDWVSVDDRLPEDGQAVLVRRNRDNWGMTHTLADGSEADIWRWQACKFVRGKAADRNAPYKWKVFGPGDLSADDVSHWCAISDPETKPTP